MSDWSDAIGLVSQPATARRPTAPTSAWSEAIGLLGNGQKPPQPRADELPPAAAENIAKRLGQRVGTGPAAHGEQEPDKVAPGGVAGVIAGRRSPAADVPPVSGLRAFGQGGVQGLTSGWGDEIAARGDQLVSKVPGLRSVAQAAREKLGGSGLPLDRPGLSYEERRDDYRNADDRARAAHPKTFLGGELTGGVLQQAIPGARALGPVAGGIVAGAGYSDATSPGDVIEDAAGGGLLGGALGAGGKVAGAALRKAAAGAPGRVAARQLSRLGEGVKRSLRAQVASPDVERKVIDILKADKAVKNAIKSPSELVAAADAGIEHASAEGRPIYDAADAASAEKRAAAVTGARVDQAEAAASKLSEADEFKAIEAGNKAATKARKEALYLAKNGHLQEVMRAEGGAGVVADHVKVAYQNAYDEAAAKLAKKAKPPIAIAEPDADQRGGIDRDALEGIFDDAAREAQRTSQHPHQLTTVERLRKQFLTGIGRRDVVPSYEVRQFLSKQLQKPAFGGDPGVDPGAAREATQRLAIGMKRILDEHVIENAGPAEAARLIGKGGINDQITAYHVIGNVAEEHRLAGKAPGVAGMVAGMIHAARTGGPATAGAVIGGLVGHGNPAASAGGAVVGYAIGKAPSAIDRALATRAGQAVGRAAPGLSPVAARALTQPGSDREQRSDRR